MQPIFKFWLLALLISLNGIGVLNFSLEAWTGKWFPFKPTSKPGLSHDSGRNSKHTNLICDDAKTNLTLDWNESFEDYDCTTPRSRLLPNATLDSLIEFDNIPLAYKAPHICMDQPITYDKFLSTFGPHRPLLPVYGEYKFIPKQRWLYNLEHGGIVALYHPCLGLTQIRTFKILVKSCLKRHIITPSRELSINRPLALLAWGVRYTMPTAYPNAIRQFIRERALRGPETNPSAVRFDRHLIEAAKMISDEQDSILCPTDR